MKTIDNIKKWASNNPERFLTLIINIGITIFILSFVYWLSILVESTREVKAPPALVFVPPADRVYNVIETLPEDSFLRANLLVILAAEYSGHSQELSETLRAYAEMKVVELTGEKK